MRNNTAVVLGVLLVPVLFAAGCTGGSELDEDGGEGAVELRVEVSPGTEFSGSCAVGDGEPEEIGGEASKTYTYTPGGKPLQCEIVSAGDLEVTLTHGSTRSVQRFGGGTLNLTYANGSLSSSTTSSSGSSRVAPPLEEDGEGSGDVRRESREVGGFDEVELEGVGNLTIRQTGRESLTVEAEGDVLPNIRTEVRDGRLILGPEPNADVNPSEPIKYELTVEDLRALEMSGAGSVVAEDIDTDRLAVTVTGAGGVRASGRAESQDVRIVGVGNYQAGDLQSKEVRIDVSGTGRATVNASDALDARVSGAGVVEYVGDPTVDQNVSGVGRVREH